MAAILNQWQERLLGIFASLAESEHFYFTDGTALAAVYLQHRLSEDIDLFTRIDELPAVAAPRFEKALAAEGFQVEYGVRSPSFIRFVVDPVPDAGLAAGPDARLKVDLAYDPTPILRPSDLTFHGIRVNSLEDIAASKVLAFSDRMMSRDYVDLYFLLSRFPLEELVRLARRKDTYFDPYAFARSLARVEHIFRQDVPIVAPFDRDAMFATLRHAAAALLEAGAE